MARRRKKEETPKVEAIVQPNIEDVTEIGMDVDGLQEIEVTEIEAAIESGDNKELVEETDKDKKEDEWTPNKKEVENNDKKEESSKDTDVEKDSNVKSEKQKQDSEVSGQEETPKKNEKKSEEFQKTSSESGPRSVKPSQKKRGTSTVETKKSEIDTSPKMTKPKPGEIREPMYKRATVKPIAQKQKDTSLRSTYGLFHR